MNATQSKLDGLSARLSDLVASGALGTYQPRHGNVISAWGPGRIANAQVLAPSGRMFWSFAVPGPFGLADSGVIHGLRIHDWEELPDGSLVIEAIVGGTLIVQPLPECGQSRGAGR